MANTHLELYYKQHSALDMKMVLLLEGTNIITEGLVQCSEDNTRI